MPLNIAKIIDEYSQSITNRKSNNEVLAENEGNVAPEGENVNVDELVQDIANDFLVKSWGPSLAAGIGAVTAVENIRRTLS